jgi:2-oxoisovalerate dehydrogenase E1 component
VVVHEDNHTCGFGAEVAATVAEKAGVPVEIRRVTRADTYIPCHFGNQLEVLPSVRRILEAAAGLCGAGGQGDALILRRR